MSALRLAMLLPGLGRVHRGAETAFLELARALAARPDFEVVLYGAGDRVPEGLRIRTVPCAPRERFESFPSLPTLRNECAYEELAFVLALARADAFDPRAHDAALVCSYPWLDWYLRLRRDRRARKPKILFATQNGDWMVRAGNREYRFFDCDGLVCLNPEHLRANRSRFPSALVPNGVDPEVHRPRAPGEPRPETLFEGDAPIVLMVSALIPSKRVDFAVEAVARVPDARLVVAGDGPERGRLAELARRRLPDRHRFLGAVDRSRVPGLYRSADAFLHASRDEPFGIVYLEAAASGLPVVAPDLPAPRWILGETARFADPDSPEAFAEALERALRDPDAADAARRARARVVADWTWERQADRLARFAQAVVRGTPPPTGDLDSDPRDRADSTADTESEIANGDRTECPPP